MPVTPIQSTYVSQYVPLPTDAIQNYVQRTEAAQTAEELVLDKTAEIQAVASGTTTDVDKPFLTASLGRTEADLAAIADMPTIGRARQVRLLARETAARLAPLQQRHAYRAATRADPRFAQYSPEDRVTVDGMLDEELGELSEERIASGNYLPGDTFAAGFANYVDIDSNVSALVERARSQQISPAEMASAGVDYNVTTSSDGWTPEMIRQIARHRLTTGETGAWVNQKAQLAARRNGTEVDVERQAIIKEYEDTAVIQYARTPVTNNYSQVPVDPNAAAAAAAAAAAGEEVPEDPIKFDGATGMTGDIVINEQVRGASARLDRSDWNAANPLPATVPGLSRSTARLIANGNPYAGDSQNRGYASIIRAEMALESQGRNSQATSNMGEARVPGSGYISAHPLMVSLRAAGEDMNAAFRYTGLMNDQEVGFRAAQRAGGTVTSNISHATFQILDPDARAGLAGKWEEVQAAIGQYTVIPLVGGTMQSQITNGAELEGWVPESYNLMDPGPEGQARMVFTVSKEGETNRNYIVGFDGSDLGPWLSALLVNSSRPEQASLGSLFAMEQRNPGHGPMSGVAMLEASTITPGRRGQGPTRTFETIPGIPGHIVVARVVANGRSTYILRNKETGERKAGLSRAQLYTQLGTYAAGTGLSRPR